MDRITELVIRWIGSLISFPSYGNCLFGPYQRLVPFNKLGGLAPKVCLHTKEKRGGPGRHCWLGFRRIEQIAVYFGFLRGMGGKGINARPPIIKRVYNFHLLTRRWRECQLIRFITFQEKRELKLDSDDTS